jgi:hypothetical protein
MMPPTPSLQRILWFILGAVFIFVGMDAFEVPDKLPFWQTVSGFFCLYVGFKCLDK